MTKRPLNKDEKTAYEKQVKNFERKLEMEKGELRRVEFNKDFLIDHNFKKLKMEVEQDFGRKQSAIKELLDNLTILKEHLRDGVEVKKPKRGNKNGNKKQI